MATRTSRDGPHLSRSSSPAPSLSSPLAQELRCPLLNFVTPLIPGHWHQQFQLTRTPFGCSAISKSYYTVGFLGPPALHTLFHLFPYSQSSKILDIRTQAKVNTKQLQLTCSFTVSATDSSVNMQALGGGSLLCFVHPESPAVSLARST